MFAKLHFQTQGDLWLCAVSWVNSATSFHGCGGLKTCSWTSTRHHVTSAGYIKPSCTFTSSFFCIWMVMTNGFTVFSTIASGVTRRQSVSERGTLSSSTVPVTFDSSWTPLFYTTVLYASRDTDLNVRCHFLCDVFALMLVLLNNCHFFPPFDCLLLLLLLSLLFYLSAPTVILLNWIHTHTEQLTIVSYFYFVQHPIRCWWTLYLYFGCDALNTEFLLSLNVPLITLT